MARVPSREVHEDHLKPRVDPRFLRGKPFTTEDAMRQERRIRLRAMQIRLRQRWLYPALVLLAVAAGIILGYFVNVAW